MKLKNSSGCGGAAGLKPANITVFALALAFGACSADVTRFDSTSFAFDDPPDTTASISKEDDNVYDAPVVRQAPRGPYGAGANEVASEPLAPPPAASSNPSSDSPSYDSKSYDTAMRTEPSRSAFSRSSRSTSAPDRGSMIVVQRGDTLYGLSRKHDVSLNDLMQTNGLSDANLRPGQKLYLPSARIDSANAPEPAPAPSFESAPSVDETTRQAYNGTYTIQPGDSLYAIARANGVKFSELQRVNGITDPRRLRPGQVIKVPGAGSIQTADTSPEPAERYQSQPSPSYEANAKVVNRPKRYAARTDTVNDATASATASKLEPVRETQVAARTTSDATETIRQSSGLGKMRWPVMGKIVSGFGGRSDGTHNDGVNLAVPLGADVQAAENGVVAYAGSELKGYGNLLLIRHENGWVTAYAHNDELLVKRGDRVRRGQVVAKAGKTGSVDRPQLHFELRKGSKPVDPTPHMESM